ncbi:MAG TPA: DinB family protein [Dongiaceae bacterium]|jgi:uncharacterized damage-inducible protein DinB
MNPVDHFRQMARNNAWSNLRLLRTCRQLSPAEFTAHRVSFFPSIMLTLNHILTVDWYYIDALLREGRGLKLFEPENPFEDCAALAEAQLASDRRLIAFCDRLTEAAMGEEIVMDRGGEKVPAERADAILLHLFQHQIHHRGQVHAMLAGTNLPPPQLDEYFLRYDRARRAGDMRELGLAELG